MSTTKKKIKVLVADDHPVVRKGIITCLTSKDNLKVVGEAVDGPDTIQKTMELQPDVILLDLEMPQLDGLAVTEKLRKDAPQVKVLILSTHSQRDYVLRIIRVGADRHERSGARLHGEEFDSARAGGTGSCCMEGLGGNGNRLKLRGQTAAYREEGFQLWIRHAHVNMIELVECGRREVSTLGSLQITGPESNAHRLIRHGDCGRGPLMEALAQSVDAQDIGCDCLGGCRGSVGRAFCGRQRDWEKLQGIRPE